MVYKIFYTYHEEPNRSQKLNAFLGAQVRFKISTSTQPLTTCSAYKTSGKYSIGDLFHVLLQLSCICNKHLHMLDIYLNTCKTRARLKNWRLLSRVHTVAKVAFHFTSHTVFSHQMLFCQHNQAITSI